MKKRQRLLTDEQWEFVEPLLPPPRRRRDNRGRPWASNRACFEGILWILQTGAAWAKATLGEVRVPRPKGRPRQKPDRVIADRGYDSDPLSLRYNSCSTRF